MNGDQVTEFQVGRRTRAGSIVISPDFTGLHRAFAEMGAAIRAMGEGLDRVIAAVTRPPVPRAATPRAAGSLSTAYHRRHVRNRRRRSR